MYFEVLVQCTSNGDLSYGHHYIVESEDLKEASRKASAFISAYYVDESKGTILVDHDNVAYKFSDGEIVELREINETTPEEFLKNRTGRLFLIGSKTDMIEAK